MSKGRLEAFSDGVIAIIITIMALELKIPQTTDVQALYSLIPEFISYLISFIFVGIYWSNHHHLMMAVQRVNGPTLWANLHLLFWLSLIPFSTAWMGRDYFGIVPVVVYGIVLSCSAVAYFILTRCLLKIHEAGSHLAQALGKDFKGKISIVIYAVAVPLAFVHPWFAYSLYVLVALIWLVPDRRIENTLKK